MHTPPSSLPYEPGHFFQSSLARLSSPNCLVDKDATAHTYELTTAMDWCSSRAVSGLLHDNEADKDIEVDTSDVVDEPADDADSEHIERLVDSQVDERANEIDHVAMEGGNVESLSVDGDTDGSDDCLAATSSSPPTHRAKKSRGGTTIHSAMTQSIVVSSRPNWLQCCDKVI